MNFEKREPQRLQAGGETARHHLWRAYSSPGTTRGEGLLELGATLAWCRSTPYMESFLAFSRKWISASPGVMPLRKESEGWGLWQRPAAVGITIRAGQSTKMMAEPCLRPSLCSQDRTESNWMLGHQPCLLQHSGLVCFVQEADKG